MPPLFRPSRRLATVFAVLAALALAGCAGEAWHATPYAVQTVYQAGVPHTDRHGRVRRAYDPATSFLPIGLYHALAGRHFGRDYDLAAVRDAGFDAIYPWEGQKLAPVAAAAKAQGLAVIAADPTDAALRRAAANPDSPVLAWSLDQEPTRDAAPGWAARLARFQARRAEVHRLDPGRAAIVIDSADFTGKTAARWDAWNSAGDASVHFNYPVRATPPISLSTTRGLPQSVARAAALNHEAKPVWLVVQAFASPHRHWAMPTPALLRAMVYAGFVHGATGVIYFALDSFVTRDDGVIGMAPDPAADYGPTPDFNRDGRPPPAGRPGTARRQPRPVGRCDAPQCRARRGCARCCSPPRRGAATAWRSAARANRARRSARC